MSLLGVRLTVLIGPSKPLPLPGPLLEHLDKVEVHHSDEGPSAFQITFRVGRSGPLDLLESWLLRSQVLKTFNRVILVSTFNLRWRVLMDGIITHQELTPGDAPGSGLLTITGEDLSVLMDLDERTVAHSALPDPAIVAVLLARYKTYGVVPLVLPPKTMDLPVPIERVPVQIGTDRQYIEKLAARHGHVFYLSPGPAPYFSVGYWGPPKRLDLPQKALSVNFGTDTNVSNVSFQHDALAPAFVDSDTLDDRTGRKFPVRTFASQRVPPLSSLPSWLVNRTKARTVKLRGYTPSVAAAYGKAQALTDASTDRTVVATGDLDASRYGDILQARGLVGMRGAGLSFDGLYYVQQVTHHIARGSYTQSFTLTRDGLGPTLPVVRP